MFGTREVLSSFFVNQLRKNHTVNKERSTDAYCIDNETNIRIATDSDGETKIRGNKDGYIATNNMEVGNGKKIPIWLFGFLY